jgi:ABC-type branched-subunit amino acid transport system permease subunit
VLGVVLVVMIIASPDGLLGMIRRALRKKHAAT